MPVWNKFAINYDYPVYILDPATGLFYSHDEARMQSAEVRSRLINFPSVVGCFVMTTEEAEACLRAHDRQA